MGIFDNLLHKEKKLRPEIFVGDLEESEKYANELGGTQEQQQQEYEQYRLRQEQARQEDPSAPIDAFLPREVEQIEAPKIRQKAPKDMGRKERKKYEQQQMFESQILVAIEETRVNKAAIENERGNRASETQRRGAIRQMESELKTNDRKTQDELKKLELKIKDVEDGLVKIGPVQDTVDERKKFVSELQAKKKEITDETEKLKAVEDPGVALENTEKIKELDAKMAEIERAIILNELRVQKIETEEKIAKMIADKESAKKKETEEKEKKKKEEQDEWETETEETKEETEKEEKDGDAQDFAMQGLLLLQKEIETKIKEAGTAGEIGESEIDKKIAEIAKLKADKEQYEKEVLKTKTESESYAEKKVNEIKELKLSNTALLETQGLQEVAARELAPALLKFRLSSTEVTDNHTKTGEKLEGFLTAALALQKSGLLDSGSKLLNAFTGEEIERLRYMTSSAFLVPCTTLKEEKMGTDKTIPIGRQTWKDAVDIFAKLGALALAGKIKERIPLKLKAVGGEEQDAMDAALKKHPDVKIPEGAVVMPQLIPGIERMQKMAAGPHFLYKETGKIEAIQKDALKLAQDAGRLDIKRRAVALVIEDLRRENANDPDLAAGVQTMSEYGKKIAALTLRLAVLEEGLKFLHAGSEPSFAGKKYLEEMGIGFEAVQEQARVNTTLYANLFGEREAVFRETLDEVDWSQYEEGAKARFDVSEYHSRAAVLMKTEGDMAENRKANLKTVDLMIRFALSKNTDSEEERGEIFDEIKALLRPAVWTIMSMDFGAYLQMGEDELVDHQKEIQEAVLANMLLSDLGQKKMEIVQKDGTKITLMAKEAVFGLGEPGNEADGKKMLAEYSTRSTVLNVLSDMARMAAFSRAAKLGVTGFETGALREVEQHKFKDDAGAYIIEEKADERLVTQRKNLKSLSANLLKAKAGEISSLAIRLTGQEMVEEQNRREELAFAGGIHQNTEERFRIREKTQTPPTEESEREMQERVSVLRTSGFQTVAMLERGEQMGEPIFRSFTSLHHLPAIRDMSESDYERMLMDLSAGATMRPQTKKLITLRRLEKNNGTTNVPDGGGISQTEYKMLLEEILAAPGLARWSEQLVGLRLQGKSNEQIVADKIMTQTKIDLAEAEIRDLLKMTEDEVHASDQELLELKEKNQRGLDTLAAALEARHEFLFDKYGMELESISAEDIRDHYFELMADLNFGMTESELTLRVSEFAQGNDVLRGQVQYYNSMATIVSSVYIQYVSSGGNVDLKSLNILSVSLRGDIEKAKTLMGNPSVMHTIRWGRTLG